MDELVNIVDDNNNILAIISKTEAHAKGLLHQTVISELIDSQGNWILVKQNAHKQDADQYVSPVGGHVTAGETWEEALKREAKEEIGVEANSYKYIGKFIYNRETLGRKENHYFIVYEIYSDEIPKLNDESVEFQKFTPEELRNKIKSNKKIFGDAFLIVVKTLYPQLL